VIHESSAPSRSTRAPARLRTQIAVLVTLSAIGAFSVMALAGWLLVLEAEDEIMESLVLDAVKSQGRKVEAPPPPVWLRRMPDDSALRHAVGLEEIPAGPGPYEIFAAEGGTDPILIRGMMDLWRVRLGGDREQEYRLLRDGSTGGWWLADLSYFEFTEAHTDSIRVNILFAAGGVGLLAILLSALIARWTLRPIVALAARVQAAPEPGRGDDRRLAEGLPDDEVGFLARALDASRDQVAASLARERQFISECSHELRTPLAVLKAAAALLPEVEAEPEGRARVLARMTRAVRRSERLVQFFLVLAREGRERADAGWAPLRTIVEEAIDDQRLIRADPTRPLSLSVPETAQVHASRDVLLMLVHNLIGNALQHAPDGGVSVAWIDEAALAIDDEGPGFPSPGEYARPRGYGLGLTLARRLCETQGWEIRTGRAPTGGARVTIVFPNFAARRHPTAD
jgi:signal transduction histidine kinase